MRARLIPPLFALLAAALVVAPAARAADESAPADDESELRSRIDELRSAMEHAYLSAAEDHARVQEGAAFEADVEAALVGSEAARALLGEWAAHPPLPSPEERAAEAGRLAARLREAGVRLPLSEPSLLVVLADAAREAPAEPSERLVASARRVFRHERFADVWDESFQGLPLVEAFRRANVALVRAEEAAAVAADATPPDPYADMVLLDRTRPWVGPWNGWTSSLKDNRRQRVSVRAVFMDRHEVTCAAYAAFLRELPAEQRAEFLPRDWKLGADGAVVVPRGRARHPVTGVTWSQAAAFAASLGKRLPTEDEWERAAAGGEKEPRNYPWGDDPGRARWAHRGAGNEGTVPVDAFPEDRTPEGVVGLAGNVAELVATLADRKDVPRGGPEPGSELVVRGGSYRSRESECSTDWRWFLDAGDASDSVGFRCVMDEPEYRRRQVR